MTLVEQALLRVNSYGGLGKSQNERLNLVAAAWEIHLAGEDVTQLLDAFDKIMQATRVAPGVYKRAPRFEDSASHDEYLGICAGIALARIYKHRAASWATDVMKLRKRSWNYSAKTNPFMPWKILETQLKPDNIGMIKLICTGKCNTLERAAIWANAKTSDSWNLHRLRGLILPPSKTRDLLRKKINYVKAICDYYHRGSGIVIAKAIRKSGGAWERP